MDALNNIVQRLQTQLDFLSPANTRFAWHLGRVFYIFIWLTILLDDILYLCHLLAMDFAVRLETWEILSRSTRLAAFFIHAYID